MDQLYTSYVTPIPIVAMEYSSKWVNLNMTCAYHSHMKGHTIDECITLKDKIQTSTDSKVIQVKEAAPNVRNNPPPPNHRGEGVNVIELIKNGTLKDQSGPFVKGMNLKYL